MQSKRAEIYRRKREWTPTAIYARVKLSRAEVAHFGGDQGFFTVIIARDQNLIFHCHSLLLSFDFPLLYTDTP